MNIPYSPDMKPTWNKISSLLLQTAFILFTKTKTLYFITEHSKNCLTRKKKYSRIQNKILPTLCLPKSNSKTFSQKQHPWPLFRLSLFFRILIITLSSIKINTQNSENIYLKSKTFRLTKSKHKNKICKTLLKKSKNMKKSIFLLIITKKLCPNLPMNSANALFFERKKTNKNRK